MDPILSIGHDMVEIARIKSAVQKYGKKFLGKIYTPEELRYCLQKHNPFPSLAARFAAKEAVAKAFQCGIGKHFFWQSAAVILENNGSPRVKLDALGIKLLKDFSGSKIIISLTHTYAIASAVAVVS
jgi:holo-[acyl-carrier protein] synthase